ncbi:hypothetical protein [Flavobacterium sp. JP2137]|uniref:hypothetical protein n=1 Tax=Flavobacterium sp. JP2137 TaxID=3414510 RepID=UPI003D2FA015
MIEKNKLLLFLILARTFDMITTYISRNGDLSGEMNILVRKFNLRWEALIISEVVIIVIFYFIIRYFDENYFKSKEEKLPKNLSFTSYISLLYYGKKINIFQSFIAKIDYKIALNDFIYLITSTTIVVSFIIGINNLLSSQGYINLFDFGSYIFHINIPNLFNLLVFIFCLLFITKIGLKISKQKKEVHCTNKLLDIKQL